MLVDTPFGLSAWPRRGGQAVAVAVAVAVANPVRVRRLSDQEGQQLLRITRRGTGSAIRLRRAMVVLASAGGNTVPAIARLVQADEDTIRQVIHRFNEMGMASLDPQWAGGRPRQISPDEEQFIVETANTRPEKLGRPFTRWSIRKLADLLRVHSVRRVRIGRKRLRQILHRHRITFQRTKTWKESTDPHRDAKLARIEYVTSHFPQRVFAFDEFGPLVIRPQAGTAWVPAGHPHRLPANYHKLHGVRQFHGCYSVGDDQLWGVVRRSKGADGPVGQVQALGDLLVGHAARRQLRDLEFLRRQRGQVTPLPGDPAVTAGAQFPFHPVEPGLGRQGGEPVPCGEQVPPGLAPSNAPRFLTRGRSALCRVSEHGEGARERGGQAVQDRLSLAGGGEGWCADDPGVGVAAHPDNE
ncbi:helix-turn-helix domain-containing protein [Micromonospora carbonacea]